MKPRISKFRKFIHDVHAFFEEDGDKLGDIIYRLFFGIIIVWMLYGALASLIAPGK